MLWRYNLFHGKDDDKMHRLTQAALKQIMKDNCIFEECVDKLADVMTGTLTISFETWMLSCDPPQSILVGLCPWDKLKGAQWVELLTKQPQFADECPWNEGN